jgi:protein TonB
VSQTQWGQDLIKVYKLNAFKKEEPPPPPEKEPEPEPEPEPAKQEPKPQEAAPPPPPPTAEAPPPPKASDAPGPPPVSSDPFAIGKGRGRFAGYTDILTASIQSKYQQPSSLSDDLEYAVLCELLLDEQGRVLQYRLINSSGSLLFDQSALDALAKVTQVRPPPEGMDRTVVVKFFPPT